MNTDYFIVNLGTHNTRIGFGGEKKAKHVLPSYVGVSNNTMEQQGFEKGIIGENLFSRFENLNMQHIYDSGKIVNFDAFETLLSNILSFELSMKPEQSTIILTEDNIADRKQRQKVCDIVFNKLNFKSILFSKTSTLSAYSVGKTTGVILDSGESGTTATIVHDGFSFTKYCKSSILGGKTLRNQVKSYVQQDLKVNAIPFIGANNDNLTQSFYDFHINNLFSEIKQAIFKEQQGNKQQNIKEYILPDKQAIRLNKKDILKRKIETHDNVLRIKTGSDLINQVIKQSVSTLKVQMQLKLYENIVVVGGNSLTQKYSSTIEKQLNQSKIPEAKVKVFSHARRKESAWLGASILSTISSLQPFCISAKQYKESGVTILDKKCP